MSASVAERMTRMASGLNRRLGASDAALLDRELATGPAWPIWAPAAAPSAWMASVSCRRPGSASGRSQMHSAWVRPRGRRQVGDGGHAGPARGHRPVVLDQLGRDQRLGHHALEGGRLDDPLRRATGPSRVGANGSTEGTAGTRSFPGGE